jgi:hypothetical protein
VSIAASSVTNRFLSYDERQVSGYQHRSYAESLAEFGTPYLLPKSGAWILKRKIPGFSAFDAMGCYPLFTCSDWSQLHADLDNLKDDGLVSLALVADPFGDYDTDYLRQCFRDVVVPFKEHFVADLTQPVGQFVSAHHRGDARKALRRVEIEICEDPLRFLDEWVELYSAFIVKRNIKRPAALSRDALAQQLTVPGLLMLRALKSGNVVGMHLWYTHHDTGYAHLAAYTEMAYKLGASYALFWTAIQLMAQRGIRWLELGGTVGVNGNGGGGLTYFKSGWSTGTRTAYFCGRIFDRERYSAIAKAKDVSVTNYFPSYRKGEFA